VNGDSPRDMYIVHTSALFYAKITVISPLEIFRRPPRELLHQVSHMSLERQLSAAQSARIEIESKLREKDIVIERLSNDRH